MRFAIKRLLAVSILVAALLLPGLSSTASAVSLASGQPQPEVCDNCENCTSANAVDSTGKKCTPQCSDCPNCTPVIDTCDLPKPGSATKQGTGYLNMILNIVFAVAASVSVLVIVINGLRYIVAQGDPGGTASAKNGIIYAVVGLLVILTAYSIVVFVVERIG